MTGRERIKMIFDRQAPDRPAAHEHFWTPTRKKWETEGHLKTDEASSDHFDLDIFQIGAHDVMAEPASAPVLLEETNEWILHRNSNGVVLRQLKNQAGAPEHVDFAVKDRQTWEKLVRPKLLDDSILPKRIPLEAYRSAYTNARSKGKYFIWHGMNVFECMHLVCGHENLLMGMALDPEWILDMAEVYSNMIIKCQQLVFKLGGVPDGIWYYEDMGFKGKPFMSPQMYDDLIKPFHKNTFDYAHSVGCKVIVHSCGYIEPFIAGMIEAGMDCLQAMEVKAGMDILSIQKKYGQSIILMGGLDIRILESNDLDKVDDLVENVVKPALACGGYIIHSDHSISPSIEYDTYRYFLDTSRSCKV